MPFDLDEELRLVISHRAIKYLTNIFLLLIVSMLKNKQEYVRG